MVRGFGGKLYGEALGGVWMSEKTKEVRLLRPPFRADGTWGWIAGLSSDLHPLTDHNGAQFGSPLRLHQDGLEIGSPHAIHESIRRDGRGHYSFWNDSLYFSTPDGSDPNTNGRLYEIVIASPDQEKTSLRKEGHASSGRSEESFNPGRLPFVCSDFSPLVFRRTTVSWDEVIPDFPDRRRLMGSMDGAETFPSPGKLGNDLSSVVVTSDGIGFAKLGTYNVLTNFGAFKFLILPEHKSASDLIEIGRFLANNTVHLGSDVSTCTYGRFTSSLINYQNLFYKLFFSDQPLGLLCCSAAFCLCALCEILGFRARRVHLTGPGRGGHLTVEVHDGSRWFVMDPDLDFIARDETGELVDAERLLRGNVSLESLSSKQLSRGAWFEMREHIERLSGRQISDWWNIQYGFRGSYTWASGESCGVACTDIATPFLRGLDVATGLSHVRSHPLIASETWETYFPVD